MRKRKCDNCLKVLSDKTRIKIIQFIQKKPLKVNEVKVNFCLTQPTISHHLKILQEVGFLERKKKGRNVFYFFNKKFKCSGCGIINTINKI